MEATLLDRAVAQLHALAQFLAKNFVVGLFLGQGAVILHGFGQKLVSDFIMLIARWGVALVDRGVVGFLSLGENGVGRGFAAIAGDCRCFNLSLNLFTSTLNNRFIRVINHSLSV